METFIKCLELVKRSNNPLREGRKWLWLNHFGEPLLNPRLTDFIEEAQKHSVEVSFASNGVDYNEKLFPRETWQRLANAGLKRVMLSAYVKSERELRKHVEGIVKVSSVWKPRTAIIHDWAGQVDLKKKRKWRPSDIPEKPCDYETHNMFAVTWDGRLAACCYDSEGLVGLTVDDVLADGFRFKPVSLCETCNLGRGDAEWL